MDFAAAILAHINWKKRFAAHLDGWERLDAAMVEKDDLCDLGKWIHESTRLGKLAEFESLKEKHAAFHRAAADIIRRTKGLPVQQAKRLLETDTAYNTASSDCVNAIATLRDRLLEPVARL